MTASTKIIPLQMNDLPDIDQAIPFSEDDEACLREIEGVLQKYGAVSRFGIALLHSHFPVHEDEILVEYCDEENRILTTKPEKRSEIDGNAIETIWRFDGKDGKKCKKVCKTDKHGNHYGYKDHE